MRVIIAHTGVSSVINQEKLDKRKKISQSAVLHGAKYLNCVETVEKTINYLENSGEVNAGNGSIPQRDGVRRMDASIMRGSDLEYGAVCSLRSVQNPISVAKLIMENSDGHNMYAHDYTIKIAKDNGINLFEEGNTDAISSTNNETPPEFGTVGSVCLDKQKNLCSGTSTGGFRSALPGRIGDSCIIGAGTYCNNVCAVSLTGRGESIVKLSMGKRIVDLVQFEKCLPQIAVQRALMEFKVTFSDGKHTMGAIAVDLQGNIGVGFKGAYMAWCALIESENQYILRFGGKENEIIEKQVENPMF